MSILEFYSCFERITLFRKECKDLKSAELIIFSLIAGLIDKNGVTTIHEVNKLNTGPNKLKKDSSKIFVKGLTEKGYITKEREQNHYGKTYLSLTEKGLFLKSRLNSILSIPLEE